MYRAVLLIAKKKICSKQWVTLKNQLHLKKGVDPFKHCITIASVCNLVFRRNFLKPDSIAVFTNQQEKNHSYAVLQWLYFERLRRGIHIDDARNGGERIGPYFVDGFAPISETIFSFHGCFWHGCPDCCDEDTIHPHHKITMRELFKRTEERRPFFQDVCPHYGLVEIWEHEWRALKEGLLSPEMRADIDKVPKNVAPLIPREAFFGGRSNGIKISHEVQSGEEIK